MKLKKKNIVEIVFRFMFKAFSKKVKMVVMRLGHLTNFDTMKCTFILTRL